MRQDLPRGTVTLLFTDVEGSTRLLRQLGPESYAESPDSTPVSWFRPRPTAPRRDRLTGSTCRPSSCRGPSSSLAGRLRPGVRSACAPGLREGWEAARPSPDGGAALCSAWDADSRSGRA